MFFRRTKTANGLDGKSYYTHRLVENQREGTKTRQKTMFNLGGEPGCSSIRLEGGCPTGGSDPAGTDLLLSVPETR